jgi:hypothetical protein
MEVSGRHRPVYVSIAQHGDAQRNLFEVAALVFSPPTITPQSAIWEFISWRICAGLRVFCSAQVLTCL